ncbi:rRNA methyltransferase [Clostridia bacterium]|nr:rRNA methyltransferase [Clostridia bacterium]
MRIVAGIARGTVLFSLPESNERTRPTLGRVKENFFNAIADALPGAYVLDLYAGTGQLGLEALSRGADKAVFVDESPDCAEIIRKSAQKAKLYPKCNVIMSDASGYLSSLRKRSTPQIFDIVFLDPPYEEDSRTVKETAKRLVKNGHMNNGGLIICETESPIFESDLPVYFSRRKEYKYGKVYITVLTAANVPEESEVV